MRRTIILWLAAIILSGYLADWQPCQSDIRTAPPSPHKHKIHIRLKLSGKFGVKNLAVVIINFTFAMLYRQAPCNACATATALHIDF